MNYCLHTCIDMYTSIQHQFVMTAMVKVIYYYQGQIRKVYSYSSTMFSEEGTKCFLEVLLTSWSCE